MSGRRGLRYRGKPEPKITDEKYRTSPKRRSWVDEVCVPPATLYLSVSYIPHPFDVVIPLRCGNSDEAKDAMSKMYWDFAQAEMLRMRDELNVEREYYARKLDELQGLVKRLLESK